ncbi:hypothetical protein [Sulfurimicrobium lacus]|uniref:hypothetical protein n=1 Tax=Sulfurimicrobium lacus TaxID=2715678 RepID=UPI0015675D13|nr:hypothetical protein [Sulfurimicrobium lacus]
MTAVIVTALFLRSRIQQLIPGLLDATAVVATLAMDSPLDVRLLNCAAKAEGRGSLEAAE